MYNRSVPSMTMDDQRIPTFKGRPLANGGTHVYTATLAHPAAASAPSDRVLTLLRSLITTILPASAPPAAIDANIEYCMRLLSSRLSSSHSTASLVATVDAVHSTVAATRPSDSLVISELLQRFQHRGGINEKWRILSFMLACRDSARDAHQHAPLVGFLDNGSHAPISGTITASTVHTDTGSYHGSTSQLSSSYTPSPTGSLLLTGGGRPPVAGVLPDAEIVRDLLFVFQGIDGKIVRFDRKSAQFTLCDGVTGITAVRMRLVLRICDLGILYRKICCFINLQLDRRDKQSSSITDIKRSMSNKANGIHTNASIVSNGVGLITQSLVGSLQSELVDYYRWLALLESQLKLSPELLTLRRLYVALQPSFRRMFQLASLTEGAESRTGGSLLSLVFSYCHHGDSAIAAMMKHILQTIAAPLITLIAQWIQSGEILDQHHEFFIATQSNTDPSTNSNNEKLWTDKYFLRESMIPLFIPHPLAHDILVMGKSVNFIRRCCEQPQFTAPCPITIHDFIDQKANENQSAEVTPPSSSAIRQSFKLVNTHLMSLVLSHHRFLLHAEALKSFLLLSQGDFIQSLFDHVAADLSKPANTLNCRALQAHVDAAIRASNARFQQPDVLRRLGVKLLRGDASGNTGSDGGDDGWDVFSLDYLIDAPLNVIITPASSTLYLRLFNFLWRLKRVDYGLVSVWLRHMSHRTMIEKSLSSLLAFPALAKLLRTGHFLRNEISHCIKNIASYLMIEVIEASWAKFQLDVQRSQSLDDLIEAHRRYVNTLADKALLQGPSSALLLSPLLAVFDDALKFVRLQDRIYDEALREVSKRETFQINAKKLHVEATQSADVSRRQSLTHEQQTHFGDRLRSASSLGSVTMEAAALLDAGIFVALLPTFESELGKLAASFHRHLFALLEALDRRIERVNKNEERNHIAPDVDLSLGATLRSPPHPAASSELEFLRFRLDFSEFYTRHTTAFSDEANTHSHAAFGPLPATAEIKRASSQSNPTSRSNSVTAHTAALPPRSRPPVSRSSAFASSVAASMRRVDDHSSAGSLE